MNPIRHGCRLVLGLALAAALAAGPALAQNWFQLDSPGIPVGQPGAVETTLDVDLDSLQQHGRIHTLQVRLSFGEAQQLPGEAPFRSLLAQVEVHCGSLTLAWRPWRFYSERQGLGQEVPISAEHVQQMDATVWLPPSSQSRLTKGACGRRPFSVP